MADNPNYELLLEEINNLKSENATLKSTNEALSKKVDEVIAFNRTLLNKPAAKGTVDNSSNDKLRKFIEGE